MTKESVEERICRVEEQIKALQGDVSRLVGLIVALFLAAVAALVTALGIG